MFQPLIFQGVAPFHPIYNWLVVSTHLKNISQNGNLPQIGVNIENIWNHHLEKDRLERAQVSVHKAPGLRSFLPCVKASIVRWRNGRRKRPYWKHGFFVGKQKEKSENKTKSGWSSQDITSQFTSFYMIYVYYSSLKIGKYIYISVPLGSGQISMSFPLIISTGVLSFPKNNPHFQPPSSHLSTSGPLSFLLELPPFSWPLQRNVPGPHRAQDTRCTPFPWSTGYGSHHPRDETAQGANVLGANDPPNNLHPFI